jgi:hypothetical protein
MSEERQRRAENFRRKTALQLELKRAKCAKRVASLAWTKASRNLVRADKAHKLARKRGESAGRRLTTWRAKEKARPKSYATKCKRGEAEVAFNQALREIERAARSLNSAGSESRRARQVFEKATTRVSRAQQTWSGAPYDVFHAKRPTNPKAPKPKTAKPTKERKPRKRWTGNTVGGVYHGEAMQIARKYGQSHPSARGRWLHIRRKWGMTTQPIIIEGPFDTVGQAFALQETGYVEQVPGKPPATKKGAKRKSSAKPKRDRLPTRVQYEPAANLERVKPR